MRVVAFGGGRGLSASLRALTLLRPELDLDLTAVVTVADNGGSSGRLRAERDCLPPGDLRQAIAALADPADPQAGRYADLLQFRFSTVSSAAEGMAGHAVGNLVLLGLMEMLADPVAALDAARELFHAVGRVLPMSVQPLTIEASVRGGDPRAPEVITTVVGQHAVAVSRGVVEQVRLVPAAPAACDEAVAAVKAADWLVFGPGSWFTSVIPHLLVPDLAAAITAAPAARLVTLNLAAELETAGLSLPDHLRALARYLPGLRVDVVLADPRAVAEVASLRGAAETLSARVVFAPVAVADGGPRHDPVALADALRPILRSW